MGCGSAKLKELELTTSTLQAEIDGLRAKQKEADAETAKHNAQENKAKTEHEDAGYLTYLLHAAEEVSSGVHAMNAMEMLSAKVMSLFVCHRQQQTLSARTMAVSLHSYHGQREEIQDEQYAKPQGFEVRPAHEFRS